MCRTSGANSFSNENLQGRRGGARLQQNVSNLRCQLLLKWKLAREEGGGRGYSKMCLTSGANSFSNENLQGRRGGGGEVTAKCVLPQVPTPSQMRLCWELGGRMSSKQRPDPRGWRPPGGVAGSEPRCTQGCAKEKWEIEANAWEQWTGTWSVCVTQMPQQYL